MGGGASNWKPASEEQTFRKDLKAEKKKKGRVNESMNTTSKTKPKINK